MKSTRLESTQNSTQKFQAKVDSFLDKSAQVDIDSSRLESILTHFKEKFLNKNTGKTTFPLESTSAQSVDVDSNRAEIDSSRSRLTLSRAERIPTRKNRVDFKRYIFEHNFYFIKMNFGL